MSNVPVTVKIRERVRVVKIDVENLSREPEVVEQESVGEISVEAAALLGLNVGDS